MGITREQLNRADFTPSLRASAKPLISRRYTLERNFK